MPARQKIDRDVLASQIETLMALASARAKQRGYKVRFAWTLWREGEPEPSATDREQWELIA